ncbi:MAG: lipopolysaccharide heptosyltransferase II [Candidatus Omnitrophica bacterium]|nr:lipopolysaccharide heptosyltransferase II [Candidatus Omnitrophota bacterium]MBU1869985.1 lipopolysaccharide heptosyltransferase II [Candidatus Omnitrophota bacterium]
MNILQILPELNVGGVETGTVDLAKYLVRDAHKAVVISNGGVLVKDLEAVGGKHYQLPVHRKSIFLMLKLVPQVVDIIRKEEIDIVHARSRVPAWIAYLATRRTNAVFITTCHGYYKKHPFSFAMGWAKRVIVLSNIIGRHMIDDFKVPYDRIRLVPRSADLEKFKYSSLKDKRKEEFNIGIIGRITPIKGHRHFIKAMAKVARIVPNLKIWIVGDAPQSRQNYKEELQLLTKRLGLEHCTEFLGTQRDIPAVLSHLNLLVLATTSHEAFGRVIIEAQASGVPVVATQVGGVVDIIEDGKNGLLIPPEDPAAMAEAVTRIYRDEGFALSLAENAYRKVKEQYSVELMVKNTLSVYKEALGSLKILIIKFSSLGDLILSTAALRAIRQRFSGNHKITFVVGEESKDVIMRCPYIDEMRVVDLKNKDKGLSGLLRLGRGLRRENFDMVIDLQNNRKSHILSFLTMSPQRFGYDNGKLSFLLNKRIKNKTPTMEPVPHQFRILNLLGIELKDQRLELWPSDEDERYIDEFLSSEWLSVHQKIVGINIAASLKWKTKNWPVHSIARLCEKLGSQDMRVVITGTEKDLTEANELIGQVKGMKLINACAKTSVNQLACLIKRCAVYISCDSSPLHVAAAVGTPFVALFGPTDARRHMPPAKDFILIKKELACSPCYKSKCKTTKCMKTITAEEVLDAVNKLVQ